MWRERGSRVLVAAVLTGALGSWPAAASGAPRLDLHGWPGAGAEATSLLQPALRAPRDSAGVAGALAALSARLQEGGWLDGRVRLETADSAVVSVRVEPGPRYRWESLAIDASPEDSAAFAAALGWTPGAPVAPAAFAAAIERAVQVADAAGHPWATLGVSAWDADSGRVRARLSGTRGPLVTISEVRLDGLQVTRPDVAERAMGRLRGLAYNPASARFATQRLEQLGVFRRVDYVGLAGSGDWRLGVLRWRVEEPRYNTFEGAVGMQGAAGVVGLARLELGNLLGTARSVSLSWQSRGKGLSDFAARYVEPMLFGRALRMEGALQQQVQDTIFTRFRWGARARVGLGGRMRAEVGFEQDRVVQPHDAVRDADAQHTSFALERDARDDAADPRRGTRERLEVTQTFTHETLRPVPGQPRATRDATGGALQFSGEWHRRLARGSGVALETQAAARFSSERVLGEWQRWPVGGSATLRGHDEEEFRADRFALSRLEWRFFLGAPRQRVALFWDHAHLETRRPLAAGGDRLDRLEADGFGFGLRMPAAGGDVDLDYGLAPGRGVLEGKVHLRLVTVF
jgi:outer membrane protein assembly factor BamA